MGCIFCKLVPNRRNDPTHTGNAQPAEEQQPKKSTPKPNN